MYESCAVIPPFKLILLIWQKKPGTTSNMTGELCATVSLTLDVCLQFYSVLDGDEDMIFMHVDNPGGAVSCFLTVFSIL